MVIGMQRHSSFGRRLPEERASFPMGILLPQGFHRSENNVFARAPAEILSAKDSFGMGRPAPAPLAVPAEALPPVQRQQFLTNNP